MNRRRIAIVGSGISGMTVARRLHDSGHEIVLFEAADTFGGHTATVDVSLGGRSYAIDTGFIVFNDWTYPNFIALLGELGCEWQWSNMSFSFRCDRTGLEYNGTSINALFAQRRNALRPSFLRMISDILRFNSLAPAVLQDPDDTQTLGEYLRRGRYSRAFVDRYIVPMGRAIWSATDSAMLEFPLRFFVEFFDRHGFMNVNNRPVWRAIKGGSREYARRLVAPYRSRIRLRTPVVSVTRDARGVTVRSGSAGDVERFDDVVFACHSDEALAMLADASAAERAILGAFPYQPNDATLHTDVRMLPREPLAVAAWNYHLTDPGRTETAQPRVQLTYNMNILQTLVAPEVFMVTLNRDPDIDPARVLGRYTYSHPVYTPAAVAAQKRRAEISGSQHTYYCGAYWRYGFHEDGVVSAIWALEDFARNGGAVTSPTLLPTLRRTA
jgi:uncharacterized protein